MTVRAESIASVLKNCEVFQSTWQEASSITSDSEMKARIGGVSASMETFDFIYGAMLGEMVLKHSDSLVALWQHKSMSAAGGQEIACMTLQTLESFRNDQYFNLFWMKVNQFASLHHVNEPQLPRQRKRPRRFEKGASQGSFHQTSKTTTDSTVLKLLMYLSIVFRSVLTSLDTKCMLHLNLCLLKHAKKKSLKKN